MAAPTFFSNRPPFHHQRHRITTVTPPPDRSPFHDNFTFSDTTSTNNHHILTFNNGTINYPTLSSSCNPPISHQSPSSQHLSQSLFAFSDTEYYPNPNGDLFLNNPIEPMQLSDCYSYSYPSYPAVPDPYRMEQKPPSLSEIYNDSGCFPICSMEHEMQAELLPLSGIYNGSDSSAECSIEQKAEPPPMSEIYIGGNVGGSCCMEHELPAKLPPGIYDDGDSSAECSMEQELQTKLPPMRKIYTGGSCSSYCIEQELQAEVPPLPKRYDGGGGYSAGMSPWSYRRGGLGFSVEQRSRERLLAQSMAARVRCRKISEKTSELGKLVPGGQRMTTSEMFQAAYKYIKFLQAQVGVLQCMSSSPGLDSELQALLICPSVHEKLYVTEKCIVSYTLEKP